MMRCCFMLITGLLLMATEIYAKDPVYRELPKATIARMQQQRSFVTNLVAQHRLQKKVTGTKADYDLIQEIVSKKLIKKNETWKLQALGIAFGDALISEEPKLRWVEVTDEWGTDPTLIFSDTRTQLNALTMISKRVEDGVTEPFVLALAEAVLKHGREMAEKEKSASRKEKSAP